MVKKVHAQASMTLVARMLLGALLFLLFASYLALPCMVQDASQFQAVGAQNSCSEQHLFKPQADLSALFKSLIFEAPFRIPIMIVSTTTIVLLILRLLPSSHERIKRRRRPRFRSLPFATDDPPRLPAFAPLRDA